MSDESPVSVVSAPAPKKRGRPKGSTNTRASATKKSGPSYRDGALGLLQLAAHGTAMAALRKGLNEPDMALLADSEAIAQHAPAIADAIDQLATNDARVAKALDTIMRVGPYGALIAAVTPLALAILTNHGVIPAFDLGVKDDNPNPA